jgi:hypothetical protein
MSVQYAIGIGVRLGTHMGFDIGDKVDVSQSTAQLNNVVAGALYASRLSDTDMRLANANPLRGRPFMRNDESKFVMARLGLDHPLYA